MKMRISRCDICKKNYPDAKIKYKYKAKKTWSSWGEEGWNKIELCQECLDKIVNVDQGLKIIDTYKDETVAFIRDLCERRDLILKYKY